MSIETWPNFPKIEEISLADKFLRLTTNATKNQLAGIDDLQTFLQGSPITLVATEADLPPVVDGAHPIDQLKNYVFTEPDIVLNDPLLIPAGYFGWIRSNFLSSGGVTYIGTDPFIKTLNLSGGINLITTAGGGSRINVEISITHELLDGQFVNITGTVAYNGQRLQITLIDATNFEVQIPFVGNESVGNFNTGFDAIEITDIDFINGFTANLFDLTSSEALGSFLVTQFMSNLGYLSPGIIRKCPSVGMRITVLSYLIDGLILEDCIASSIIDSTLPSLDDTNPTSKGLIIRGPPTARVVLGANSFDMLNAGQRPVRIDSTISSLASITIQNCPDNLVADDYFDTGTAGLDQTDPRVTTLNNGSRANSMFIGGWFHTTNVASTTILDGTFSPLNLSTGGGVTAFAENERFSIFVTSDGTIQYDGLVPRTVLLIGVLGLMKSGSTGNYNLRYAISRNAGAFIALPTPIERLQSISTTTRDTVLNQEVIMEPGDRIRIEIEGVGTTDSVDTVFGSLDVKG